MENASASLARRHFFGRGFGAEVPHRTVLNLFRLLFEDPDVQIFIRDEDYARGGVRVADPRVIEGTGDRSLKIIGLVSHRSRFNFAIRTVKDVQLLGRKQGGRRGPPIHAKVYRTYNIIRDGEEEPILHKIGVRVSAQTFERLVEAELIPEGTEYGEERTYTIDLRGMPHVGRSWGQPGLLNLVALMREEQRLMLKQRMLRKHIQNMLKQRDWRETSRQLKPGMIYRELTVKVPNGEVTEYSASTVEYKLVHFRPATFDPTGLSWTKANELLRETTQELNITRFKARTIIYAAEKYRNGVIEWRTIKTTGRADKQRATFDGAELLRHPRLQTFTRT